ncbi:helix-hairpin-helix domain-containing protein [Corynebacterium uropygiale]|uniref:Helix-hairpin-helix domain-containing protein n=1 Tax=Corynebacterium uropygiale TaxID=1775911 RepID=A0A9X1QU34_9CORY|nr:helix-hairpin-helix domain-containing protein [Corynebacterium uropygiale]MCF4007544.1 helix-hairpin-helix domain-containing protein [Corynebacterium uropygiale]
MKRSTSPRVKDRLADLLRPTGEEELMAVSYPTPRWRVSIPQAIGGLCALLLLVLALLGALLWRGGQDTQSSELASSALSELPAVLASESLGASARSSAQATPGSSDAQEEGSELVVSVVGAVEHPGIVTLAPGARVDDALRHAAPYPDAQVHALNLAQKLSDGEQLYVPAAGEELPPAGAGGPSAAGAPGAGAGGAGSASGSASGGAAAGSGMVALNSASAADLVALPGVGQKTAEAIIAHRDSLGGFQSVEQLMDVKGIGPAKFAAIKDHVRL